jgi:hypothetical protein
MDAQEPVIVPVLVAPTLTYARRRTVCDCCGNERRWHAYVDGVPQCRHAPALDDAAEMCADRPGRVCRLCARAVGAEEWPGRGLREADDA